MSEISRSGSRILAWYRDRIGEPRTDDEVYGYWAFVFGVVLALLGVVLFLVTTSMERPERTTSGAAYWNVRAIAYVLAAIGLPVALVGAIIRMPLRRRATRAGYLGIALCLLAALWFVVVFPGDWQTAGSGNASTIIGLYTLGLVVISVGGVLVPLLSGKTEAVAAGVQSVDDLTIDDAAEVFESQAEFELYEDSAGEWRWRLRHRNGNIIADSGEGYNRRSTAQQGLNSVRRNAPGAPQRQLESDEEPAEADTDGTPDTLDRSTSRAEFELYEDSAGEWRWRLRHDNGNIIADSGEGYTRRSSAQQGLDSVRRNAPRADYLRIDPTGFEIYEDSAGEWRWRLVHRNGNVLADSGEGYRTRSAARAAVDVVVEAAGDGGNFEVYEDAAGEYRWRLSADGGIVADSGEGYASESYAHDAVERIGEYGPDADVLDISPASFEIFEDDAGEWRWRLRHRNGNVIADSGEGYTSRSAAREGIDSVKRNAPGAEGTRV